MTVSVLGVVTKSARAVAVAAALLLAAAPAGAARSIAFTHTLARLQLQAPGYTLTLSARNGKVLALRDRAAGRLLTGSTARCLWGAIANTDSSYLGGCSFAPGSARRFTYRWSSARSTLTLTYASTHFGTAVVTVHATTSSLDLRLSIANRGRLLQRVRFPDGLDGDTRTVSAGYAPNALPGVRLKPAFFSRVGTDVQIYPSRWAFADYLAYDAGSAHLALYTVAPAGPLHPAQIGFAHTSGAIGCGGTAFCVIHEYETWIRRGTTWTSPVVRLRVGGTVEQSVLAYKHDNAIDAYPSVAAKLGTQFATYARAPLIKANVPLVGPFRTWASRFAELPSPAIIHPAGFQAGGFDRNDPDFLPLDPTTAGSVADFAAMIAAAHAHGDLVMPYGNLSWWDPQSPSLRAVETNAVAALDPKGAPQTVSYGEQTGVIVSPYAPAVKVRVARYMDEWFSQVPSDCLFIDQVGARPWLYDFNPAAPTPLAYDDGWLDVLRTYSSRCLMVEDGWDRLARNAVGFHGSLLMMSREVDLPDTYFGAGNWEPYPLATWLFHDKVLMYEHDLYDGTMARDDEVLAWNMLFGLVGSYSWDALAPGRNPQLDLVSLLQQTLGPHYAGVALSRYRELGPSVAESTFGDLDVVGNLGAAQPYVLDGYGVAPHGFLARTNDGSLVAADVTGTFDGVALTPGTHDIVVQRTGNAVTVRQPVGADTDVGVVPPPGNVHATALGDDGRTLGVVDGRPVNGRFVFHYASTLEGAHVAAYRVS